MGFRCKTSYYLWLDFEGPEYISICRGYDGREIARTDNIPRGGEGSKVERAEYWMDYWGMIMEIVWTVSLLVLLI